MTSLAVPAFLRPQIWEDPRNGKIPEIWPSKVSLLPHTLQPKAHMERKNCFLSQLAKLCCRDGREPWLGL